MSLLDGEQLKIELINGFKVARKVTILSAYFTVPAAKLLLEHLSIESSAKVVVRARPGDLLAGSTDLQAIRLLHENGICCHIHRSLHAKLYVIDNKIGFVGSSNFTSNGLKISGYGNLELSTPINITESELSLVNEIVSDSILVTASVLSRLEEFLLLKSHSIESEDSDWWEDVLDIAKYNAKDGLFIADLPWCNIHSDNLTEALKHDKDIFSFGENINLVKLTFKRSKVYQFLKQKLIESGEVSVYFGQVTEWVHSALKDDTLPYRSEIKIYIANLYSYVEFFGHHDFIVDRPNYSQRITLLK